MLLGVKFTVVMVSVGLMLTLRMVVVMGFSLSWFGELRGVPCSRGQWLCCRPPFFLPLVAREID
jgi:hypothetical protein